MTTNPNPDPTRESGDDDPELADGIIVENSTIRNATVTIHLFCLGVKRYVREGP